MNIIVNGDDNIVLNGKIIAKRNYFPSCCAIAIITIDKLPEELKVDAFLAALDKKLFDITDCCDDRHNNAMLLVEHNDEFFTYMRQHIHEYSDDYDEDDDGW